MALREFLEKRLSRLRQHRLSSQATTTCKVCGAPLRGDEVKCPYCGTAVKAGEIRYAKTKKFKVKTVKSIIEKHFLGRKVEELLDDECQWYISCQRRGEGKREGFIMPDTCFEVTGVITDTTWEEMNVSSYNPKYDSGAKAVAEELKLYTNVNLFLSGG